jgi:hypothetical protein
MAGHLAADRIRSGESFDDGNIHHSHADYGSFTLFARGQYLVVPPGYARRGSRFQSEKTSSFSRFEWSVHADPEVHRLVTSNRSVEWLDRKDDSQQLTLEILHPRHFAWERTDLLSTTGRRLLATVRLSKPELYEHDMRVLSVLSWQKRQSRPTLIQRPGTWGLSWPDDSPSPAVFFTTDVSPNRLSDAVVGSREQLWFSIDDGHDPTTRDQRN